jgi:hypothetical protein
MAKMIFEMDDDLEERFRKTVADVKGLHKGVIKESLEEAIDAWIAEQAAKMKRSLKK